MGACRSEHEETRVVYWYFCICDVRSKYCDEYHRASARVPLRVLDSYVPGSRRAADALEAGTASPRDITDAMAQRAGAAIFDRLGPQIANAREWTEHGRAALEAALGAADAIEAIVKERDRAIRDLDAGFAESDHLSAKYYQQMRAAERDMHARELHHFEEEQKSAGLAAEVERLRLVHAGQARLALSAVFMADVDDDEGVQEFYREWVRNHDAALIESLADDRGVDACEDHDDDEWWMGYRQAQREIIHWLTERARQVREGEA